MAKRIVLECRYCGAAFVDVETHARHEAACAKGDRSLPAPPAPPDVPELPLGDVPPTIRRVLLGW